MKPRFGQPATKATYVALLRASIPAQKLTDELVDATVEDVERLVAALPSVARRVLAVRLPTATVPWGFAMTVHSLPGHGDSSKPRGGGLTP